MMPMARVSRLEWDRLLPWFAAVLVVQAAFVIARDTAIVGVPPIGTAQGTLLQDVYNLSTRWSAFGWLEFWRGLPVSGGHPTAATVLASLAEVYGGGGRLALLLPELALLLASELAFAAAALRLTRSPALAALGLGLLLLRTRPWLVGTGLFTVNTDWLTFCIFGLVVSLMIAPPARHHVARVLACAALGCATLCFSPSAFACLLVVAALRLTIGGRLRARGIAASFVLAGCAAYLLWAAPHCPPVPVTGIRLDQDMAARCGFGLRTSLLYLGSFDLGLTFVLAAVLLLGAGGISAMLRERGAAELRRVPRLRREAIFLVAVLVALACIQVARRSADPIGSGLIDIPLTALLLAVLACLMRRRDDGFHRSMRLACFGFLPLCALLPWGSPILDTPPPRPVEAEAASWLVRDAEANERSRARILVVPPLSLINGPSLSAFFYETFGEGANFTVAAEESADIDTFDYAVVPVRLLEGPAGVDLLRQVNAAMIRRAHLDPQGADVAIYSVPNIAVAGVSGGWLQAEGASLRFDAGEIPAGSVIALRGPDGYARYVPDPPTVTALATTVGNATLPLPARFVRQGDAYAIFVDPAPLAAAGGRTDVALTFDRFFVPKDIGMNADPRRLTVMAPTSIGLAPRSEAFEAPAGEAGTPSTKTAP